MEITRERIIETVHAALEKQDWVFALWLEGSDGLKRADSYSDIDFWFDVQDGRENESLQLCLDALAELGPLDFVQWYEHPHPQIFQVNAHVAGTPEYLLLDICVQSHGRGSKGCTFVEGDCAEFPLILFDKASVVCIVPEPAADTAELAKLADGCKAVFRQRSRIVKYLHRGKYLEAFIYYQKYACEPVVNLLRLLYTPRHSDYGLVHVSDHFPRDITAQLEQLYQVSSLSSIEARLPLADALFEQTRAQLIQRYPALTSRFLQE